MKETAKNDNEDIERAMSQDSEYDDTLCVPDSLDLASNENTNVVDKIQEDLPDCNSNDNFPFLFGISCSNNHITRTFILVYFFSY